MSLVQKIFKILKGKSLCYLKKLEILFDNYII